MYIYTQPHNVQDHDHITINPICTDVIISILLLFVIFNINYTCVYYLLFHYDWNTEQTNCLPKVIVVTNSSIDIITSN